MKKCSSFLVVLLLMLASFTDGLEYPRGDVNQDEAVDIADVTCLIDNVLQGVMDGDVDKDGQVDISDVTVLIYFILNDTWPDEPVTPPDNHEYVDLGLPSGTLWATCNVGADTPKVMATTSPGERLLPRTTMTGVPINGATAVPT